MSAVSDAVKNIWPPGMPESLWNFDALRAPRNIPFMGYQFSPDFYLALAAGGAVIVFFALRHFNEHTSEPERLEFRVLRELKPMDLRSGSLMTQAYVQYVGALLLIYVALTLFGNLIFNAVNSLPSVAGLQVDTASFDFDSPQWPLLISFGMVGFVPMLKPVEMIEKRLRAWAHRSAGIPTKVTEQTNRVKKALDALTGAAPGIEHAPDWLPKIATDVEQKRAFKTRAQLRYLLDWSKDQRPYWPAAHARAVLDHLETEETGAAFLTLEAFDDLLMESFDKVTNLETPSSETEDALAEPQATYSTGAVGAIQGNQDALVRHRRRLEREWNDLTDRMETQRDELASMLAVFIEHDDRYDEIQDPALHEVVESARPEDQEDDGPGFWLYLSLFLVAWAYLWAIDAGHHSLLSNVDPTAASVTWSVVLNTAKTAIQFCVPMTVVMTWRYGLRQRPGAWTDIDFRRLSRPMVRQMLRACGLALVTAAALFALLALLWAALISRTEEQFQQLYLTGSQPYLLIYSSQAVIAAVSAVISLIAVDYARLHQGEIGTWALLPLGALNALLVLCAWGAVVAFWYGFGFCQGSDGVSGFVPVVWKVMAGGPGSVCFSIYEGVDLYVYAALAFCSASVFIPVQGRTEGSLRGWARSAIAALGFGKRRTRAGVRAGLTLLAAVTVATGLGVTSVRSQEVRLGFRNDVPPFSYYDRTEKRYRGYLVDLCYRIFGAQSDDRTDYQVVPVDVTATNRFNAFRPVPEPPLIDVLCDPVTVRFPQNSDDTRDGGLFSPIVFASGVSYLQRRPTNTDGTVLLGYIDKSTAVDIAERACQSDLFKVRPDDKPCDPGELSALTGADQSTGDASGKRLAHQCYDWTAVQKGVLGAEDDPTEPWSMRAYYYCVFESHTAAIEWFCADEDPDGNGYFVERAYFGDRDIIVGKLEAAQEDGLCPAAESKTETYTYEPYALVIKRDVDLARFVQRRVYQIFSNRDEIAAIFSGNFDGKRMTRPLANLFLINAVEPEE